MKAFNHCRSSVKQFGGCEEDYLHIHRWFDESKDHYGDIRHRALRHHTLGVKECEKEFGEYIILTNGKKVPTRSVAEQHIMEDLGFLPTIQDWLKNIVPKRWMASTRRDVIKRRNYS